MDTCTRSVYDGRTMAQPATPKQMREVLTDRENIHKASISKRLGADPFANGALLEIAAARSVVDRLEASILFEQAAYREQSERLAQEVAAHERTKAKWESLLAVAPKGADNG